MEGLRIGLPNEFFGEGVEDMVKKTVWDAVDVMESLGATYEEISLPSMGYALAAYYIVAMSEASSNLARYDGLRYGYRSERDDGDWSKVYAKDRKIGFGTEVRRRVILGTYALSAGYYDQYYLKALKVRTIIRRDFDACSSLRLRREDRGPVGIVYVRHTDRVVQPYGLSGYIDTVRIRKGTSRRTTDNRKASWRNHNPAGRICLRTEHRSP